MEKSNVNVVDDSVKVTGVDERFIYLLAELSRVQSELLVVLSTRFDRNTIQVVDNVTMSKENEALGLAQRYGQPTGTAEALLAEYRAALEEIRAEYANEKNLWLAEAAKRDVAETEKLAEIKGLKDDVKKLKTANERSSEQHEKELAAYQREIEDAKKELAAAREEAKKTHENIDDCGNRCVATIDENSAPEQSLEPVQKEKNIFAKFFEKIKDKIGGKEKFETNVIAPLKKKIRHLREEVLPKVKDDIEQKVIPKLKELYEKGKEKGKELYEKGKEKAEEMHLKEKFQALKAKAKEGAKKIVEKAKVGKEKVVAKVSAGIEKLKDAITIQEINMDLSEKDIESI